MRLVLLIARRVAIVVALILVLLHPGYGEAKVPARVSDLQVLMVVDRTRSMAAEDYDGHKPRIDGVRTDLKALTAALPGARFGLMTFGFDSRLELPFTNDSGAVGAELDTLQLEAPTAGIGSQLDRPKEDMISVLKSAQQEYPNRRTVVVFVSDGENTSGEPTGSMADVAPYVAGGVVLGYGTTKGGAMPNAADLSNSDGFIQDPATGRTAISHEDPAALARLAHQLGVRFVQRDAPGGMAKVADSFKSGYVAATVAGTAKNDLTWVFGLVLLALVLIELRAGWTALWTSRKALR